MKIKDILYCDFCHVQLSGNRKRFCCNKHKDMWHNLHNPRGYGKALIAMNQERVQQSEAKESDYDHASFVSKLLHRKMNMGRMAMLRSDGSQYLSTTNVGDNDPSDDGEEDDYDDEG